MTKKLVLLLSAMSVLMIAIMLIPVQAMPPIKRPNEILTATIEGGEPETIDSAWAYDTASGGILLQVYDTLLTFDGEHTETFIGQAAESWVIQDITGTTSPEDLAWTFRYVFKLRSGMKFHDGSTVTTADVEYSFERGMVQDRDGGPQWMFYEPLLNTWGALGLAAGDTPTAEETVTIGKMIDHAVESNDTHVWFNLAFGGSYGPFLQILSQTWSSILSKNWVVNTVIGAEGRPDWNGEWGDYSGWFAFHAPGISPFDDPTPVGACGSGPFEFESLDFTANQWSVVRFEDYWNGWPAPWPKLGSARPSGYVDRFVETWAFTWETRSTMFLAGDCDFCAVVRQYMDVVLNKPGIRVIYPLPTLAVDNLFFQFDIVETTPYGPILEAGTFDETGIPSDFFGNAAWGKFVRRGFSFALDYATLIAEAFQGEASHPATAIIPGLFGYDSTVKGFTFNLTAAAEEFHKVPGLWETGFTITLLYNTGNQPRQRNCELLEAALEGLNPKFHVTLASSDWRPYLIAMIGGQLPSFIIGWLADFPDAHNFATPFYASWGTFSAWQNYANPEMDALINAGINEVDPATRAEIYHDIQVLAIEDCPNAALQQAIGRHFERDWIVGWYYNVVYPDNYIYNLWKWYYTPAAQLSETPTTPTSNRLPADINYDGKVNILDMTTVAQAFGASYGPPIHARWQFRADMDNNRVVDIRDITAVATQWQKTSATWTASS